MAAHQWAETKSAWTSQQLDGSVAGFWGVTCQPCSAPPPGADTRSCTLGAVGEPGPQASRCGAGCWLRHVQDVQLDSIPLRALPLWSGVTVSTTGAAASRWVKRRYTCTELVVGAIIITDIYWELPTSQGYTLSALRTSYFQNPYNNPNLKEKLKLENFSNLPQDIQLISGRAVSSRSEVWLIFLHHSRVLLSKRVRSESLERRWKRCLVEGML